MVCPIEKVALWVGVGVAIHPFPAPSPSTTANKYLTSVIKVAFLTALPLSGSCFSYSCLDGELIVPLDLLWVACLY